MDIIINFNKRAIKIKVDFILFSILFLATILRIYNIGYQSPWLDELSTFQVSDPDLTFDQTHTLIMTREGFPHFYFLCLKFLSNVFGHSIVTLRMFSAFFGICSIYLIYLLVKEFVNQKAGYIAALLMAVNGFHIYHSQEARAYALLVFFVLFASYRMLKYIKNQNWKNAILLGIACGLIPNAHPLGVLNIGVIYLTIFIFFIRSSNKIEKFKQLLFSATLTLLVFSPVYQIISKLSKISSFWVPQPSLETIKLAFFELLSSDVYIFYLYIISIFVFFGVIIFKTKNSKRTEENNVNIIFTLFIAFWIIINIGTIILKSYLDVSIIVNRYFIGSFPLFMITLSYCFSLMKNKYLISITIILFIVFSLYSNIIQKNYYESVSKSQWNLVSSEIIQNNKENHKIYSAYGFVSNILFKNTNCYNLLREVTFENYLKEIKADTTKKEPFWYFDGNFRPYNLGFDDQLFLDENYNIDQKIEKYDCWARHYIPKTQSTKRTTLSEIRLNDFSPLNKDENGFVYLFQNGSIKTNMLKLTKGDYRLEISANSLPEKPLNNENARIVFKINDKKVLSKELSELKNYKENTFLIKIDDEKEKVLEMEFVNDFANDGGDRNVVIYDLKLKKLPIKN
jgi:uncharacterized membrane protein